jgi:hypothetical protein
MTYVEHFTPNGNSYTKKDFIIYTNRLPDTPYYNGVATNMAMVNAINLIVKKV